MLLQCNVSVSHIHLESDSEFSEQDLSDDDEFTVNKKGGKKKTDQHEKTKSCKSAKKEKKPVKPPKAKSQPTGSILLYNNLAFMKY